MKTKIIKIDADCPNVLDVKKAAGILKKGGIVALPTETVYGLAVYANDNNALKRLYSVKKRPDNKPFTIQISDYGRLADYIDKVPTGLKKILDRFWPGPLTIIVNGKSGKIGLRIPDNKVTLAVINEVKLPLAVTSANISGEKAVVSAKEVADIFGGSIDLIVDDGDIEGGIESTVLDCTVSPFKILRKGSISEELKEFITNNT
jgi:L-threonylcarbamoyladenylate synthase